MIDLSYKPKKDKEKKEEDRIGIKEILLLTTFAILFWLVLTESFIHGIY